LVNIWQRYEHNLVAYFLGATLYVSLYIRSTRTILVMMNVRLNLFVSKEYISCVHCLACYLASLWLLLL